MNAFLSRLMIVGVLTSSLVMSNVAAAAGSTQYVSIEASVLLMNEGFAKIVRQRVKTAAQSGRTLRIHSFSTLNLGTKRYVYAMLAEKTSADIRGRWTAAGSIVGSLKVGPLGELTLDGVYFKPQEEGPGGASVGNN